MNFFSLFFFLFSTFSISQIPNGYYNGTAGLSGYALKSKLHEIISKNYNWNYADLPNYYKQTDLDVYDDYTTATNPNNGIYILMDIYSEKINSPDAYEYNSTQLIGSATMEGMGWNREHLIPQSTFSIGSIRNYPMYSDLFTVIPADARINQLRSNYPFGNTNSTIHYTFTNNSKIGDSGIPGYNYTGRVYEPIDEFKGDIARSILYFVVRYESKLSSFNHFLGSTINNDVCPLDGTLERGLDPAYISLLKQWHLSDPVSQREIDRNNAVYSIQKNRNPFIDNPQWVEQIWSVNPDGIAPNSPNNLIVTSQNAHFVNLEWSPSTETDVLGYKVYMNGNQNPIAITKNNWISIDRLQPNTSYTFTVKCYDTGYLESPNSNVVVANTTTSDNFAKDLLITKFLEGSGNNKAIEITNLTGHKVNLNNYNLNIQLYNSSSNNYYFSDSFQLEGEMNHGDVIVVLNPNAQFSCFNNAQAKFVTASTPLTFTGSQYVELAYKGLNTVDAIGIKGISNSTGNRSLYRLSNIKQPNSQFDLAEWQVHPSNYCTNLGVFNIKEEIKNQTIEIFPNPSEDYIFVKGEDLDKVKNIQILDSDGKLVFQKKAPFTRNNYMNISELTSGAYIVIIDGKAFKILKR